MLVRVGNNVLAFNFNPDNGPPPSAEDVIGYWGVQRAAFPKATLQAGTLDDFAAIAWAQKDTLPRLNAEVRDGGACVCVCMCVSGCPCVRWVCVDLVMRMLLLAAVPVVVMPAADWRLLAVRLSRCVCERARAPAAVALVTCGRRECISLPARTPAGEGHTCPHCVR
jgi:hypothetical protein